MWVESEVESGDESLMSTSEANVPIVNNEAGIRCSRHLSVRVRGEQACETHARGTDWRGCV